MTPSEYLLTVLSEECGEVIQNNSKAIRFGMTSCHPLGNIPNIDLILQEYYDIVAVMELMQEWDIIGEFHPEEVKKLKEQKKRKVEKYMKEFNII